MGKISRSLLLQVFTNNSEVKYMISKLDAVKVVQEILDKQQNTSLELKVDESKIIEKPYGYIIFYQTQKYLMSGDEDDMILGMSPFIIGKKSGEVLARLSSKMAVEISIPIFEKEILKN